MTIKIFGESIIDTDKLKALEAAASAAGHTLVQSEESSIVALASSVEEKFPALAAAFKTGFADVENSDLKGLAKMEKVVVDILPKLPEIAIELVDLPNVKDLLVQMGQTLYTSTLTNLEAAAKTLVSDVKAVI